MTSGIPRSRHTDPEVGDHVRHPLYPELGEGIVQTAHNTEHTQRTGYVQWANGMRTRPCLGILRIVKHT